MKDTLTRVMLGYAYPVSHTEITSLGWQLCKIVQCFYFFSEIIAHLTNKEGLKKNVSLWIWQPYINQSSKEKYLKIGSQNFS